MSAPVILSPIHHSRSPYSTDATPSSIGLSGLETPVDAAANGHNVAGVGRSSGQQFDADPPPMNVADFHFHEHLGMKTRLLNSFGLVSECVGSGSGLGLRLAVG